MNKKLLAIIVGQGIGNQVQMLPAINEIYNLYSHEYNFHIINTEPHCILFTKYLFKNLNIYEYPPINIKYDAKITFPFTKDINLNCTSLNKKNYPFTERMKVSEVQINIEAINNLNNIANNIYNVEHYFPVNNNVSIKKYDIIIHNGCNINPINPNLWKIKLYNNMNELVNNINKDYNIACIGNKNEYINGCINETGRSIEESVELIRNCKLFISNDTGTYHIAAALKKKGIVIFTATSHLKNYNSIFHNSIQVIRKNIPCSPCQIKGNGYWLGCQNNRDCTYISIEDIKNIINLKIIK